MEPSEYQSSSAESSSDESSHSSIELQHGLARLPVNDRRDTHLPVFGKNNPLIKNPYANPRLLNGIQLRYGTIQELESLVPYAMKFIIARLYFSDLDINDVNVFKTQFLNYGSETREHTGDLLSTVLVNILNDPRYLALRVWIMDHLFAERPRPGPGGHGIYNRASYSHKAPDMLNGFLNKQQQLEYNYLRDRGYGSIDAMNMALKL